MFFFAGHKSNQTRLEILLLLFIIIKNVLI